MTDTQPGTESNDANWNRQASTFDWEGWIAEENAADAERAQAKAAAEAEAATPQFPTAQLNYPAPSGPPISQLPNSYPPPVGLTQSFNPPPPASSSYGWRSPDGHPMPTGYAQPGASYAGGAVIPTSRPRDTVSLLAFIFGIIAFVPIAFVLGIIGIVRTANPIRRGRWMAVTGLILSIVWTVGIVGGVAYFGSHLAHRDANGVVDKKGLWPASDMRVGDCYHEDLPGTAASPTEKRFQTVMPCTQPHNAQVFASTTVGGEHDSTLATRAIKACDVKASVYFRGSTAKSSLESGVFFPNADKWAAGNRTVFCAAIDPEKDFTGQAKDDQ